LAEIGPLRLAVAESEAEATHFLAEMVRQKTRRYLETHGEDQFDRPGYRAYFPAMTERFRSSGLVQIAAVYVGDTIIATHWGLVANGRFHYLMPTFEGDDWRRFSPGRVLVEELIAWSYANGLHTFDFGPGDEPFKDEFGDQVVPLLRIERPASVIGNVQQTVVKARRALAASPAGPLLKDARNRLKAIIKS
jgi:CelD/BcsL family acetyltransferase involved in cellulose biosynthesis